MLRTKVKYQLNATYTTSESLIKFTFTSAIIPNGALGEGSVHGVVCSVKYGDDLYLYTGISTLGKLDISEKRSHNANGEIIEKPTSLKIGESAALTTQVHLTHRGYSFQVSAFNVKGRDDVFHIGKPFVKWGTNFERYNRYEKVYHNQSLSGNHNQKVIYTYPVLVNEKAGNEDLNTEGNRITITIPLTALNTHVEKKSQQISFIVQIDDTDVWLGTVNIDISNENHTTSLVSRLVTSTLLNTKDIYPGSSAIFEP